MGEYVLKITWITIIIAILILFLILWLFVGGEKHEYIGVGPLYSADPYDVDIVLPEQREEPVIRTLPDEKNNSISRFERQLSENQRLQRSLLDSESKRLLAQNEAELLANAITYKPVRKSKGELAIKKIMEQLYGVEFKTVRPPELRSPETGRNLEIDVYSDNIWVNGVRYKIGVEYNGIQHYIYPNFTGQTVEQFKAQIRRDVFKRQAADYHGIYLITVPYTVKEKDMRSYIISLIPDCMLPENYEEPVRG